MMSSANRFMLCDLPCMEKPKIFGCVLILSARGSISRLKIEGERGQPCLVPFDMLKVSDSKLDVKTCAQGEEYNARIADSMGPANPYFCRVWFM